MTLIQTNEKAADATNANGHTDTNEVNFPTVAAHIKATSYNQKPAVLILGYLIDTHMQALTAVAKAHGKDCISFGDLISDKSGADPWLEARALIDKGDALFVHICHDYLHLFGVAAAGLAMYALAKGGQVVLMFDTDVTIYQSMQFESITRSLGWRAHSFIQPDATPDVLKHYLAHTRLFKD